VFVFVRSEGHRQTPLTKDPLSAFQTEIGGHIVYNCLGDTVSEIDERFSHFDQSKQGVILAPNVSIVQR